MTYEEVNAPTSRRRALRFAKYFAYSSAAFALPIAADRLFVSPWLQARIGAIEFGLFVWITSLTTLLSIVPANGFATILLREAAALTRDQKDQLLRRALMGSGLAATLFTLLGLVVMALLHPVNLPPTATSFAFLVSAVLLASGLARGVSHVLIANLRFERRFGQLLGLKVLEVLPLLFVPIVFTPHTWLPAVLSLYAIGLALQSAVLIHRYSVQLTTKAASAPGSWLTLLTPALAASIFSGFEQLNLYSPRLLIGMTHGEDQLSVFFASASIGNLFVIPMTLTAGLGLSLLASRPHPPLSPPAQFAFLSLLALASAFLGILSWTLGVRLLNFLYPALGSAPLELQPLIATANGFTCASLALRTFAIRYASLRLVNTVSAISSFLLITSIAIVGRMHDLVATTACVPAVAAIGTIAWLCIFLSIHHRKASQ